MLNEILEGCKTDICWYKNWCKTRKKTGSCILQLFTEVPTQNLKCNVKQACIFHLILVGISYSLIQSIKNEEDGGVREVFTQRPKSVKHDESYLSRIP